MKKIAGLVLWATFAIAGLAQIEVASDGKVGIGTSSPGTPLHVYGQGNANRGTIRLDSGNAFTSITTRQHDTSGESEGFTSLVNAYNGTDNFLSIGGGLDEFNAATSLLFYTGSSISQRTGTVRMAINSSGNVGIGTTTPAYALHVVGDAGVSGDRQLVARYNNTSGDYRASLGWSHLQLGNNGPNWIVAGRTATGGSLSFVVNNTADYAYAAFNGTTAMHITAGARVGIGTTSPAVPFEVTGAAVSSPLYQSEAVRTTSSGHTSGFGVDGSGSNWGTSLFQDGTKVFTVESNGGALIGANYVAGNAPANGLAVEGNVGIGTASPSQKLEVNGSVKATSFISSTTTYADFVFKADYRLAPLSEVEAHIREHGHLPDVPSEAQVAKDGIDLAAMQVKLLQKVEELTLHQIAQEKQLRAQQEEIRVLRAQLNLSR